MIITLSQDSEIVSWDVHSISQLPFSVLELLITFLWGQKLPQRFKYFIIIDTLMSFPGNLRPFPVYSHDSHGSFYSKSTYKNCKSYWWRNSFCQYYTTHYTFPESLSESNPHYSTQLSKIDVQILRWVSFLQLQVISPNAFEPFCLLGHRFIHLDSLTTTHVGRKNKLVLQH